MAELGHPIPVPKLSSSVGMFDICCVIHTTGENDRQFDPELRAFLIFSENCLDFSLLQFKVKVTNLPTFKETKCLQILNET